MRLTKAIKEEILQAAISKSPLVEEAKALIKEKAEIAEKLRRLFVSKEDDDYIESVIIKIRELKKGKGMLRARISNETNDSIKINHNGQVLILTLSGFSEDIYRTLGVGPNKKHIYKVCDYYEQAYSVKDDLGAFANNDAIDDLVSRAKDLTLAIKAVLSKANTDGQLLKLWPECKELIPKEKAKQSTALMVNPAELNALIGLPS